MLRTCTKGCAHCCYQAIYVSETETRIILNWLRLNNIRFDPLLPIRLEKWNASFNRTELFLVDIQTDEFKEGYFHAHIPCPFLGSDNTCEIYPVRPLCCRHYFSVSAPEHCEKSPFVDDTIILRCWDLVVLMKLLLSRESTWLAGPTILEKKRNPTNA
ncbi:YkgJ family cysteine cluster protein [Collibacillus ludicampi]|uniref:YkgJ family cysteine cluster protein n=1 Tax=Collibacillus ludicampi TaxID=2771369 RepID=UPI0034E1A5CC